MYALDVEPVATSHECDYPPEAASQPSVVEPRINPDAASTEIHAQVQTATSEGGVYDIDHDTLADADPDIVIAQGICEVCAVDTVVVEQAVEALELDCDVVTTDPHRLHDVFDDIHRIGEALDRPTQAAALVDDLQTRVDQVADTAAESPIRPDVTVLDWLEPVMVAGHWIPDLIDIAGGTYELAEPGDASRPRNWSDIRAYDPDLLVAAPCGFELSQTFNDLDVLTNRDGWRQLRAVRMNRAYAMDGHHYVNRPGPRLVDTLEAFAAILHPDSFESPMSSKVKSLAHSPV